MLEVVLVVSFASHGWARAPAGLRDDLRCFLYYNNVSHGHFLLAHYVDESFQILMFPAL